MARSSSQAENRFAAAAKRKAIILGAVAVIALAIAFPTITRLFADPNAPDPTTQPIEPNPVATYDSEPERHVADAESQVDEVPAELPPAKPAIETSATGDLALTFSLRWKEFEEGERVQARVRFTNHSLRDVYFPSAGEPDQGLAIVIENSDCEEVRRVVEAATAGQLPRRMEKLASAAEITLPIVVITDDEKPLPVGTYKAWAELTPDPRLARLGLPLWNAPNGPVRSAPVEFVVKAKAPK